MRSDPAHPLWDREVDALPVEVGRDRDPESLQPSEPRGVPAWSRWCLSPPLLLIIHTTLVLGFMLALDRHWTDFEHESHPYFFAPLFLTDGLVYLLAHVGLEFVLQMIPFDDPETLREVWILIPGGVCLILGGFLWWSIPSAYTYFRDHYREIQSLLRDMRRF